MVTRPVQIWLVLIRRDGPQIVRIDFPVFYALLFRRIPLPGVFLVVSDRRLFRQIIRLSKCFEKPLAHEAFPDYLS